MKYVKLVLMSAGMAARSIDSNGAPLEIDTQHSKIEVAVSSTVDSFTGRLEKYEASVDCEPAQALPAKADLSFDFSDLKTGNASRDAAMLKWLAYEANPKASFQLTGWSVSGATNIASGRLTLHGVTVEVRMPTVVTHHGAAWEISGRTTFDYRDFKLTKIRKALLLTVDPSLTVKFHLEGSLAGAK
jgi:polyisoprenoid-binding protein YceI